MRRSARCVRADAVRRARHRRAGAGCAPSPTPRARAPRPTLRAGSAGAAPPRARERWCAAPGTADQGRGPRARTCAPERPTAPTDCSRGGWPRCACSRTAPGRCRTWPRWGDRVDADRDGCGSDRSCRRRRSRRTRSRTPPGPTPPAAPRRPRSRRRRARTRRPRPGAGCGRRRRRAGSRGPSSQDPPTGGADQDERAIRASTPCTNEPESSVENSLASSTASSMATAAGTSSL